MRKLFLGIRTVVVVPAAWSIVSGAMFGVIVGGILRVVEAPVYLQVGIIVFAVTFIVSWILWVIWLNSQWNLLNSQQGMGKPPAAHARFEMTSSTDNGKVTTIYEFQYATPAQMATLADKIASGHNITMPLLEQIFGFRGAATSIRDELLDKHYIRWRNPEAHKEGMEITNKGRPFFRTLANNPSLTRWVVPGKEVQVYRPTHRDHSEEDSDEEA